MPVPTLVSPLGDQHERARTTNVSEEVERRQRDQPIRICQFPDDRHPVAVHINPPPIDHRSQV